MPSTGHPAGDLLIYLAAVLVALGTVWRYVWPALRAAYHVIRTIEKGAEDYRASGGFSGLAQQVGQVQKELHPNGGSSMRDDVQTGVREARAASADARRAVAEAERVAHITEDLREALTGLRQGQAAVDQRINTLEEREAEHQRRNVATSERIEAYLAGERDDLVTKAMGLEASVTELLNIREEPVPHTRSTDPETPDHEPDL